MNDTTMEQDSVAEHIRMTSTLISTLISSLAITMTSSLANNLSTPRAFTLRFVAVAAGLTLLSACATVPRPAQELQVATAALESARGSGAPQYAAQQWQLAQEKLGRANQLLQQKQHAAAQRALQQATADARLAAAMAQLQMRVTEQSALQQEIDQLQQRIATVQQNPTGSVQE